MQPKVLIATPTAFAKDYCFDEWAENVKSLTYENKEILIIDNTSNNNKYFENVIGKHLPAIHINSKPNETNRELLCRCQNRARDYFLEKNFDFLFMLESDIFPPVNVVEHLLSFKKDVIGLPYFTGQGYTSRPLIFDSVNFGYMRLSKPMNIGKSFRFFDGKLKEAFEIGLGCLLIKKNIVERFPFRVDLNDKVGKSHSDTYFHQDLKEAGVKVWLDTSVFCHHQNKNWRHIKEFKNL